MLMTAQAQLAILNPSKDNTLYEIPTGAFSNGIGEYLFTGTDINGREQRTVMHFDIAGNVPGGATIDSVRLTIQVSVANSGAENIGLFPLTSDWGEGTSDAPGGEESGAPSTNNDATWVHTFWPGSTWTTQGGDFVATSVATTSVAGPGSYEWNTANMITNVQNWLDNPSTNFGWMVKYESGGGFKRFYSKDNAVPSLRPTLHVYYSTGSNNPPVITMEPADSAICVYDTASFSVAGTGILGYQWQEYVFSNWSNVVNGGLYSGANSATLFLSGPSLVYDGYKYRCIVTGLAAPDDTSSEATLNVVDYPVISIAPGDSTICQNDSIVLTGTASGASTYQWFMNGVPISGANNSTYTTSTAGIYNVLIANATGCADSASFGVNIQVTNCTGLEENEFGQIQLYPNPATNQLFISVENMEEPLSFEIIATDGRIVATGKLTDPINNIDVAALATGIYHAKLTGSLGTKSIRFVVK